MSDRYINRELSWLEFNQRVLNEARDERIPLLERLKFLAIASSNLDEFFMVRFGGLQILAEQNSQSRDPAGLTPGEQVQAISDRAARMVAEQYACFENEIEPGLAIEGIRRVPAADLEQQQLQMLGSTLLEEATSVLAPIAVGDEFPWPHLGNLELNLCVRLEVGKNGAGSLAPYSSTPAGNETKDDSNEAANEPQERYAIIPISRAINRINHLPADGSYLYVLCEDALASLIDDFFPGQQVLEVVPFRITRNADMSVREDSASDLLSGMTAVLDARIESPCVRLEIAATASDATRSFLMNKLSIRAHQVFSITGPLDLSTFFRMADAQGFEHLRYEKWQPQQSPEIDTSKPLFETIADHDVMLTHPYQSFDPVVRLIEQAANDPDVLAIKQTLYRTSRNSPIVAALKRGAENGKNVTALVELKARFDEERNIGWARHLELGGVHVIYGVRGLKCHAKICVIVRREPTGIVRYIHYGTGNYNEATASIYSDVSLMTCDEDLGHDAISFFNSVCGYSEPQDLRKLEAAPIGLRDRLLDLIKIEKQHVQVGHAGHIQAKVNSLVDPILIEALYEASQAGVKIELNVRGICCLRPGVPGLSENIRVVSIVDRFLEHARIVHFHHGGDPRVFISSADWMPRNLDRRLELLVPIESPQHQRRLIKDLGRYFADNSKSWELQSDGSYKRLKPGKGKQRHAAQHELYLDAEEAAARAERTQLTTFEPHRNPEFEN